MITKLLLLIGVVALMLLCPVILRNRLACRIFFLAQLVLGLMMALFPQYTQCVANTVGVQRGNDLLLYLVALFCYFAGVATLRRFRQLERQITQLTRELAIAQAQKQDGDGAQPTTSQDSRE